MNWFGILKRRTGYFNVFNTTNIVREATREWSGSVKPGISYQFWLIRRQVGEILLPKLKQVAKEYGWVAPTGTVTDSSTGLMWQKKPDGVERNWEAAKKYCRDLKRGGFSDWKLPNGKELRHVLRNKHILDPYKISAKWDSSYWSSQTAFYLNVVNFGTGKSISYAKRSKFYVRCVR